MEFYAVKQSTFLGASVHYVCQNVNGPCPLLAICNVLILRRHLNIQPYIKNQQISSDNLIQAVKERLIASNQPAAEKDELTRLTKEKIIQDVIHLLPSLLVGLDVNVRFQSTTDFEYTVACAVFDMLDISLLHGWIVDDQDILTMSVIGHKSYNELIEILANFRASLMNEQTSNMSTETAESLQGEDPDRNRAVKVELETEDARQSCCRESLQALVDEAGTMSLDEVKKATELQEQGPILEEFFNASGSQLTYFGLIKLHEDVRERQLCVFFRNNHFSTLFKYKGSLYLLVTDTGYLDEPTVVWEHLTEIDGDTEYYNAEFKPLNTTETKQQTIISQQEQQSHIPKTTSTQQQLQNDGTDVTDADYLLALKLQKEEEALAENGRPAPITERVIPTESDHVGSQRLFASANSATFTVTSGQRTAPQGSSTSPNARPDTRDFVCDSDGRVILSEEEVEAQRKAETYFKQQKEKQDRTSYLERITNTARRTSARRADKQNDCSMM